MRNLALIVFVVGLNSLFTSASFGGTISVPSQFSTIQAGIDAASASDTVQVAPGIYEEHITMKSGVIIQGAGAGDDPAIHSIIDGTGTGTVVTANGVNSEAKLDGFKITKGHYGGGMYNNNSSPTVTNCIFSENSSTQHGGGMCNFSGSSPKVINCIFSGNTAQLHGGGIFNSYSSPTLTNCIFAENKAAISGGGIRNDSSTLTVTNCTFYANQAESNGGISNYESSTTAVNCILWGNVGVGGEIGNDSSTMVINYSDISGGYWGDGNINLDPLFVNPEAGDFHLQQGSPCIDSGDNSASSLPADDFEWDVRIFDGDKDGTATVDMGADEWTKDSKANVTPFIPLLLLGA